MSLIRDGRTTSLYAGRKADGFEIELTFAGCVYKRVGFDTIGAAYRWACEQAYGEASTQARECRGLNSHG
jgi:hypothetical protein